MKKKILIFSLIFIIIDQLIKFFIRTNINLGKELFIIPHFFYLTYAKNTGGAFSVLDNNVIFLILVGLFIFGFLLLYLFRKENISKLEGISYTLLIGGIIGNLIDRVFFNHVIDYIGLIFGSYYYPVFNFADIGIVISIIILVILEFKGGKDGNRS